MKVLLVEDNSVNQRLTRTMLERSGFQVEVADSGLIALQMVRDTSFHLILMDCWMPGMDGIKCTKEIRKFNRDVPVIALTMSESEKTKKRCLKAGMNDFVSKPVGPSSLEGIVHKWVRYERETV